MDFKSFFRIFAVIDEKVYIIIDLISLFPYSCPGEIIFLFFAEVYFFNCLESSPSVTAEIVSLLTCEHLHSEISFVIVTKRSLHL